MLRGLCAFRGGAQAPLVTTCLLLLLLLLLLSPLQGSISDDEMAESGMGLIIAGNDTSGLGVTALLAILPLFPEVLDKLRQEQEAVSEGFGMGGDSSAGNPASFS
jgi:cytochrome P450